MTLARAGIHGRSRVVGACRALLETSEVWPVELLHRLNYFVICL